MFTFILYGDLPPSLPSCVCVTSGSKHCEALCDFGCHPLRASMPAAPLLPSPACPIAPTLPPTSHLPSVLALSPLIIWAGPLFYGRETFGWWVWAWLARSPAPLRRRGRTERRTVPAFVPLHAPAAAATAATPLVLNRDRRGRRHLPTLHVVPHCRLNICKPLKP